MQFLLLFLLSLPIGTFLPTALAASKTTTKIRVELFKQPCDLHGPFDETTLRAIHAISPERIYPAETDSGAPVSASAVQKAIDQLRSSSGFPAALDRYKEKLIRRFEAQLAFYTGMAAAKKTHTAAPLLALTRKYFNGKPADDFVALSKKIETEKKENSEALLDLYNEKIEPDPEEEFHRVIQKLDVQYDCFFEESVKGKSGAE